MTGDARMEAFLQLAQRRGRLAHEVDLRWVRVLADGFRISVEAVQQYRPRPYPGRVTLFRAQEHQDNGRGLTQGWDALAREGVDVQWVSGTHQSLVRRPHVAEVAERLRAILGARRAEAAEVAEHADAFSTLSSQSARRSFGEYSASSANSALRPVSASSASSAAGEVADVA